MIIRTPFAKRKRKNRCSSHVGFCRTTADRPKTKFGMTLVRYMNCLSIINDCVRPIDKMDGFVRVNHKTFFEQPENKNG